MKNSIRVLAVDQARNCGWSVWDYNDKSLLASGALSYPASVSFEHLLHLITEDLWMVISEWNVDAVFFEDTQYQMNIDSFKKLCWLQGALILWLKQNDMLYEIVPPSRWQGYCNARGRSSSEIKEKINTSSGAKKKGKALTIEYVRDNFGIETDNDNLADAVCIGFYVVNNIALKKGNK